jgi:hypothetical protein
MIPLAHYTETLWFEPLLGLISWFGLSISSIYPGRSRLIALVVPGTLCQVSYRSHSPGGRRIYHANLRKGMIREPLPVGIVKISIVYSATKCLPIISKAG